MKPLHFFAFLLLLSCSKPIERKTVYFPSTPKYSGLWVSTGYIEHLQAYQSTREADYAETDLFYQIGDHGTITALNIHEGGGENQLLFTDANTAVVARLDTGEIYDTAHFSPGQMRIESDTFIFMGRGSNAIDSLVNTLLITGTYHHDSISFQSDGTIEGWGLFNRYRLVLNYNDIASEYDKIELYNTSDLPQTFIYSIQSDTLNLYKMVCKTMEDETCMEIDKGELLHQWIRSQPHP